MIQSLVKFKFIICASFISIIIYSILLLRRPYFFDWDEWSLIINFLRLDYFHWLFQPHLGHYFPIGKFIYSIELCLFRDNYILYVITNLVVHVLNCILLFNILKKLRMIFNLHYLEF